MSVTGFSAAKRHSLFFFFAVLSIQSATPTNATDFFDVGEMCGTNFCPGLSSADTNSNLIKPDSEKINLLSLIFLGCMGLAVLLVAFGVDTTKR